jgi:hypothetical protein
MQTYAHGDSRIPEHRPSVKRHASHRLAHATARTRRSKGAGSGSGHCVAQTGLKRVRRQAGKFLNFEISYRARCGSPVPLRAMGPDRERSAGRSWRALNGSPARFCSVRTGIEQRFALDQILRRLR